MHLFFKLPTLLIYLPVLCPCPFALLGYISAIQYHARRSLDDHCTKKLSLNTEHTEQTNPGYRALSLVHTMSLMKELMACN